ncbi:hypothetical protein [uncultured Cloacibacillus sp.]|uniref:hypothetical protein n=1 Tax=uncultured Cloacibacillus sp. TaxID=889794 RepID=UPI0026DD803E|nr:hypothetical protein [uncultured Cloacibacillus sp.]
MDEETIVLSRNNTYYNNIKECFKDHRRSLKKAIKASLKGGYNVNYVPQHNLGCPILHVVLSNPKESGVEDVMLLLSAGADVNVTDNDGWTGLMYTVYYNWDPTVIKEILDRTKDINALSNNSKRTALGLFCGGILQEASYHKHRQSLTARSKSILKDFLDAGADPELDRGWIDVKFSSSHLEVLQKELLAYIEAYREHQNILKTKTESAFEYEL